jgi:hypothetical protein
LSYSCDIYLANKLYMKPPINVAMSPQSANMTGMPMSAPNASTVPWLNPGVSFEVIIDRVTSVSIIKPPKEYKIPASNPTNAIKTVFNFVTSRILIFFSFGIIYFQ